MMNDRWLVWREAAERAKPQVSAADILRAVEWYEGVTGEVPRLMALNPKNQSLALDGIELRVIGGVSIFEIWLASREPVPVSRGHFSAVRDREVIEAGGFYCEACLTGKPASEQSRNRRYCQGCYDYLRAEGAYKTPANGAEGVVAVVNGDEMGCDNGVRGESVTGNGVTDSINARITEMATQGLSCRAIERELAKQGLTVSYRTAARIIQKQRQGVLL